MILLQQNLIYEPLSLSSVQFAASVGIKLVEDVLDYFLHFVIFNWWNALKVPYEVGHLGFGKNSVLVNIELFEKCMECGVSSLALTLLLWNMV